MTFVLQFTEPRTPRRMFENIRHGLEQLGLQADAIGSSSQRGRNRGAAVEADAIREQQSKADAIGEQQSKRMQLGSSSQSGHNWGAVEADAIG